MRKLSVLVLLIFSSMAQALQGQQFPFDTANWDIDGEPHIEDITKYIEGKHALKLFRAQAIVKDFEFLKGEIEFDVFVTENRGFPGIVFRMQDDNNYEEFYVRPHQSGNPDANQYTPVFNGVSAWQLYYGEGFSKAHTYEMNAWNHVKLVIAETEADLYIGDMHQPILHIPELKFRPRTGKVGFRGSGPSAFYLADLKVTEMASPVIKGVSETKSLDSGMIKSWSVSSAFEEKSLERALELKDQHKNGLEWQSLDVEGPGYANLARVAKFSRSEGKNTTFAKVTILSDRDQVKKLSYGFSDRVKVYLNNKILAGGQDNYASRDYRFLGTMGFFDDVYLDLKEGENELWMAVSENFGGWGIMGKFDDLSGIELKD